MRIEVAGAGAGKTTNMASRILNCEVQEGRVVFCVAFTNAAANNIRAKLAGPTGSMPENIKVSTIHSFLYAELIQPFYHLLFGKRYRGISIIGLPDDSRFRNSRIKELDSQGLLHQTAIPQRAKWVVYKKSGDKALVRSLRAKVLTVFAGYCHGIYVDEAQDIDKEMKAVLTALDSAGIDIELHGDPKQDVKGHNCLRELIEAYGNATYRNECHRCPQLHLQLSNKLARNEEQQVANPSNSDGSIEVLFESQTDVAKLIEERKFGLAYISRKNERFNTRSDGNADQRLNTLRHDIEAGIRSKHGTVISDLEAKRCAYYVAGRMVAAVDDGSAPKDIIRNCINAGYFDYEAKSYARMADTLKVNGDIGTAKISIKSIEAIKGLEAKKCLFILTTGLAPYLMGDKKDDNKTMHLLYVALTRSLDELVILVTREVEEIYPRDKVLSSVGVENQI